MGYDDGWQALGSIRKIKRVTARWHVTGELSAGKRFGGAAAAAAAATTTATAAADDGGGVTEVLVVGVRVEVAGRNEEGRKRRCGY